MVLYKASAATERVQSSFRNLISARGTTVYPHSNFDILRDYTALNKACKAVFLLIKHLVKSIVKQLSNEVLSFRIELVETFFFQHIQNIKHLVCAFLKDNESLMYHASVIE